MTNKELETGRAGTRTSAFRATALAATVVLGTAAAQPAMAQDSGWSWTIAPYIWGTGLKGDVAGIPGVPPIGVDVDFGTILDNLDFGGMVVANGNNGQWGITTDIFYAKISTSSQSVRPLWSQADVRVQETIFSLSGEYKISESPTHELWASAGIRYWDVQTDVTLVPGLRPLRTGQIADDWVDPIIGLRGRTDLGEKSYLTGWAYVGGFGAGSDEMYDIFGGFGYQFTPTTSGIIGYRHLAVDRVDGAFVFDMTQSGPILGLAFNF